MFIKKCQKNQTVHLCPRWFFPALDYQQSGLFETHCVGHPNKSDRFLNEITIQNISVSCLISLQGKKTAFLASTSTDCSGELADEYWLRVGELVHENDAAASAARPW